MILDHKYHRLDQAREYLSYLTYPLLWSVNAPIRLTTECKCQFASRRQLMAENERLRHQQFLQAAQLQKLTALEAENLRLHTLLNSSPRIGENLKVAEILQMDADPFSHNILINKGREDNVTVGQPIVDEHGIMGEIVKVHAHTSRAILLTDSSHAIPVENVRNGVRGIIVGTGSINALELQYVPTTADIQEGDMMVTSGMGGRYPPGYPVGVVTKINQDKRESFASIRLRPAALLERGRQLLLVEQQVPQTSEVPDIEGADIKDSNTEAKKAEKVEAQDKEQSTSINSENIKKKTTDTLSEIKRKAKREEAS